MDPVEIIIERLTRDEACLRAQTLLSFSRDQEWDDWTVENLLADRSGKWERSLLARIGSAVVGYAIVSERDEWLHLHHLMVAPEHRSCGIGKQLVAQLLKEAEAAERPLSLKVHKENAGAIRFYEGLGFKPRPADSGYLTFVRVPVEREV